MNNSIEENLSAAKFERKLAVAGLAAIGGGLFVVSFFNPTTAGFFPVCPLYKFTGIACPGCGLTRAFHALLHGDLATALGFNALLPFFFTAVRLFFDFDDFSGDSRARAADEFLPTVDGLGNCYFVRFVRRPAKFAVLSVHAALPVIFDAKSRVKR